jgi:hypothetical protein
MIREKGNQDRSLTDVPLTAEVAVARTAVFNASLFQLETIEYTMVCTPAISVAIALDTDEAKVASISGLRKDDDQRGKPQRGEGKA